MRPNESERSRLNRAAGFMAIAGMQAWPRLLQQGQHNRPTSTGLSIRNRLEPEFSASTPQTGWIMSITQTMTGHGKRLLQLALDLFDQRIDGWLIHHTEGSADGDPETTGLCSSTKKVRRTVNQACRLCQSEPETGLPAVAVQPRG